MILQLQEDAVGVNAEKILKASLSRYAVDSNPCAPGNSYCLPSTLQVRGTCTLHLHFTLLYCCRVALCFHHRA